MRPTACTTIVCALLLGCSGQLDPVDQLKVAGMGIATAAISDSGSHVLVGSLGHGTSLWRLEDRERLFDWSHNKGVDMAVVAADFSPDGNWALTAEGRTLTLWDVQTGEGLRYWQAPAQINAVQLGPNGDSALLGLDDRTAVLFDVRNGGIKHTLGHAAEITSVAISDDGDTALTGSADYNAVAWNLHTGEPLHKIRHNDEVQLVALSPDGELALSMSQYDRALVWSVASGEAIAEVPLTAERLRRGERFTAARFSRDEKWLLTGQPNRLITLWRVPTPATSTAAPPQLIQHGQWQIPSDNPWRPSGATVVDVAFGAEEGQLMAIATDGKIYWLEAPKP